MPPEVSALPGCLLMAVPWAWVLPLADDAAWETALAELLHRLRAQGPDRVWLGATAEGRLDDAAWQARLVVAARRAGVPAVAAPPYAWRAPRNSRCSTSSPPFGCGARLPPVNRR